MYPVDRLEIRDLWDYANMLEKFFSRVITGDEDVMSLADQIFERLDEQCKGDFFRIVCRTQKAIKVVKEYMQREPVELYNQIYRRRRKSGIQVQDYGCAIGFQARRWNEWGSKEGEVVYDSSTLLDHSLEEILNQTPKGLSFIAKREIYPRQKIVDLQRGCWNKNELQEVNLEAFLTNLHELEHIISGIIGHNRRDGEYCFSETAAELFCMGIHVSEDKSSILERLERRKKLSIDNKLLGAYEQVENNLKKIAKCNRGRNNFPTISYVVCLSSPREVPRRIREVKKYLY